MISFSKIGQVRGRCLRYAISETLSQVGMRYPVCDARCAFRTGYIALYLCPFRPPGLGSRVSGVRSDQPATGLQNKELSKGQEIDRRTWPKLD